MITLPQSDACSSHFLLTSTRRPLGAEDPRTSARETNLAVAKLPFRIFVFRIDAL